MQLTFIKNKKQLIIFVILLLLVTAVVGYTLFRIFYKPILIAHENYSCITSIDSRTAQGSLLKGLLSDGASVKVEWGYYKCNVPSTGDIVAVQGANKHDVNLKVIRAMPGDEVDFVRQGTTWQLLVNKKIATTSIGAPYQLTDADHDLLVLYFKTNNIVGSNSYLLLSNIPETNRDSTFDGLVARSSIIGKVITQ